MEPIFTVTVHCEMCGRKDDKLERRRFDNEQIWWICHGCEAPLKGIVHAKDAVTAHA